jgi:hypothetical protein
MRSLSKVVMSQIKLIPIPSWLVYFVLKAQPFFINFETKQGICGSTFDMSMVQKKKVCWVRKQ